MPQPSATPDPAQPAGRCNCQALRQAARRATALYDAALAPYGLRISQYAVLNRLARGGCPDGGGVSLHALADQLLLDRTTLGRNLAPLERDGLVASAVDPADRRIRRLALTDAGHRTLAAARPGWDEAQRQFETAYGPAQADTLRALLHGLIGALDRTTQEGA